MTEQEFKLLHDAQLEIMDEVHRVCEKNNIPYYLGWGTALGAARHKGFIPWDLDIDVTMLRADYERFIDVCKTDLDTERFTYRDYKNTPCFHAPHALIYMNNTVLVNKFDKFNPKLESYGIYIDIIPYDNVPDDINLRLKHESQLVKIKRLKERKRAMCYSGDPIKKLAKKLISAAIFWTSVDKLNQKLDKCMRKYEFEQTQMVSNAGSQSANYQKECLLKTTLGTPTPADFEGRKYLVPEKLDQYLTGLYGDYMTPPPESERNKIMNVFEGVAVNKK